MRVIESTPADRSSHRGAEPQRRPRRIAVFSFHTSPLEQPGIGDAGGLNVYVLQTSRALAQMGIEVEVFTRATSSTQAPVQEIEPGLRIHHIVAGPFEGLDKESLPLQLSAFIAGVLRAVNKKGPGYFDLIHSHYWMSGQAAVVAAEVWQVPLVHTAHTLAAVKNEHLADGDEPEPESRRLAEQFLVDNVDRAVVNTDRERDDLVRYYDAEAEQVDVIAPGADLTCYSPGEPRGTEHARRALGLPQGAKAIGFIGRIQPLKAPDLLLRAFAELVHSGCAAANTEPQRRRYHHDVSPYRLIIVGGLSGSGARTMDLGGLAVELGVEHLVTFLPPRAPQDLAEVYRAVDIVAVPSYNETFGLVALEAQACGTPVVAANVGGLSVAIADGETGVLVEGHDVHDWAVALQDILEADGRRIAMALRAPERARQFSWEETAHRLMGTYAKALDGAGGSNTLTSVDISATQQM